MIFFEMMFFMLCLNVYEYVLYRPTASVLIVYFLLFLYTYIHYLRKRAYYNASATESR